MSSIKIEPSKLEGSIEIPSSKSLSHRVIICAALCKNESLISNVVLSEDIKATIDGIRSLGAEVNITSNINNIVNLKIKGNLELKENIKINCRESGSTLRFLIPLGIIFGDKCEFSGYGKLVERPLDVYYKIFKEQSISYENQLGKLPLKINGKLKSGYFEVDGNISSQFISGLLFTLPLLHGNSTIKILNNMESKGYIDLTLDMLKRFGIHIENYNYKKFFIRGNQEYKPYNYRVEGDFSQGAFFLVANALCNNINITGLNNESLQGDKEILNIINKIKNNEDRESIIDASQIPDLVPIISVLASLTLGKTRIDNAGRLRIKESDRLKAICSELYKLGANIKELDDGIFIEGKTNLIGGNIVQGWNDHRIVMALAIVATKCEKSIIINESDAVKKSYPDFWEDYRKVGGKIFECSNR